MENLRLGLEQWIAQQVSMNTFHITPITGDASFRSYYRIKIEDKTLIAMLAPPEKERTDAFVHIAKAWGQQGIQVPKILAWEEKFGFVLLSDFGDKLLLDSLSSQTANFYYHEALMALMKIQASHSAMYSLPPFDVAHIRTELNLFSEWFLTKLLGLNIHQDFDLIEKTFVNIIDMILQQPQVPIHRDYHSRNLMILENNELGIIDFQDAMIGPITYDPVSLLKDCYIQWPQENVTRWLQDFYDALFSQHLIHINFATFEKWFDWTGLQRHLKVLGIFARLKLRDNKSRYLCDMPRIMNYVLEVCQKYPELAKFETLLQNKVIMPLQASLQKHGVLDEGIKVA